MEFDARLRLNAEDCTGLPTPRPDPLTPAPAPLTPAQRRALALATQASGSAEVACEGFGGASKLETVVGSVTGGSSVGGGSDAGKGSV